MFVKKVLGFLNKGRLVSKDKQLIKEPENSLMKEPPDDLMVIKKIKKEKSKNYP